MIFPERVKGIDVASSSHYWKSKSLIKRFMGGNADILLESIYMFPVP